MQQQVVCIVGVHLHLISISTANRKLGSIGYVYLLTTLSTKSESLIFQIIFGVKILTLIITEDDRWAAV